MTGRAERGPEALEPEPCLEQLAESESGMADWEEEEVEGMRQGNTHTIAHGQGGQTFVKRGVAAS